MADNPQLSEQEKADLVAYLDGELTGEARRAVETKLSLDPTARAEADTLKKTWDLLDFLPKPEPSPSFTNRTLEKLAPIRAQAAAPRKRRPWLVAAWAAALVAAAAAGYGGVAVVSRPPPRPTDDLEYLKQLDQPDLFGDDSSDAHEDDPALWAVLERYADWVNGLPPDQQKRIDQAGGRDERLALVKALRRGEWIDRQAETERDELRALSPTDQATRVAELRRRSGSGARSGSIGRTPCRRGPTPRRARGRSTRTTCPGCCSTSTTGS